MSHMPVISPELARSALEAAPDAMIIIDASGIVRYANRQICALFGYSNNEVVGQSVELLMPERFRSRHFGHRAHYFESGRVRPMGAGLQLFGRRCDGSEFPVEISLSPLQAGTGVLVAAAIRDVTDRKRVEAELIEARESAERAREAAVRAREAADRARDIADQARESADRANQGKSRFLATASHDLRQPLQALALLNGTLRRMIADADAAEALAQQEQAIGAMSRLLNALLDISKLESGAIKPEPTDFAVATLFEELRREFRSLAANKGLQLHIEPASQSVHSDPSLVGQVLRNLVSNAIKYTGKGAVSLRSRQDDAAGVRIEVLDTGIGIPQDQLRYIFDEFYQVGVPTNSSREGYGLGLSIVQRISKLLNLKLDVHSEVDKGSSFALVLPPALKLVPTVGAPGSPEEMTPEQHVGQLRVLLIEDDPAVRNATRLLLKVEGYHVTAAASLDEALQHVRNGNGIDLLVTDYHLGNGATGTQATAALRETLGTSLKVVLITGDTSSAIKGLPRDPHLRIASKPVKAEEFVTLLRALLAA